MEEIPDDDCQILSHLLREKTPKFSYFVHDFVDSELQALLSERAHKVFANSAELSSLISSRRPDVISVFSPGARVRQKLARPDLRLLTAGMAHKIRSKGYADLARLLDGETRHIRLEITSAIHEGQRFDESFFSVAEDIRRVFRHDIHFCGFLSDEELSQRLHMADAYVAFFPRGVRENNTTVLSAMTHGCAVITNLDEWSPKWMCHGETILDIGSLERFPDLAELYRIGQAGMRAASPFSFDRLASILSKS
jgi:glycosyltransferase involved in cell wall biosynthesis